MDIPHEIRDEGSKPPLSHVEILEKGGLGHKLNFFDWATPRGQADQTYPWVRSSYTFPFLREFNICPARESLSLSLLRRVKGATDP